MVILICSFAVIRLISRGFEIVYAFGNDVLGEKKNSSGLNKQQRIKLAFNSYFELYIISIPVYYYFLAADKTESILMSLSVGSLTNIGYVVNAPYSAGMFFAFVHVLATLTLVVLSLTLYVSRDK